MASFTRDEIEGGFATPAAAMIALALAIPAAALTASSLEALRLARTDYAARAADYRLAGAQQEAVLTLLRTRQDARLRWSADIVGGPVTVIAEPEAQKLSLADASALDDANLRTLDVSDAPGLRASIAAIGGRGASDFEVEAAAPSVLWRMCGRSLISPYGEAHDRGGTRATTPIAAVGAIQWRVGQTWRVGATDAAGWNDDRIIRFTGEPGHPAAVVERRFSRRQGRDEVCETLFPISQGSGV